MNSAYPPGGSNSKGETGDNGRKGGWVEEVKVVIGKDIFGRDREETNDGHAEKI